MATDQITQPLSTAPWWQGAVIYQVYPRSYCDANGDGIGDLAGIVEKLDYIASLNVDAIWLSPFFPSPMDDFGYDVSDYVDVDPMFGTLADFDRLIAEANQRGLKIIIDLVLSHTSDQHIWFKESRQSKTNSKADWYVWADCKPEGSPPNNWLSIFGGSAWEWDTTRQQYYLHNFLTSQPDLNMHNLEVQDALLDVARFWLERGVGGFRFDTANMYTHDAQLRDNPPLEPGQLVNGIPAENPYSRQQPIYNINRPENLLFIERLRKVMDEYGDITSVGEVGATLDMGNTVRDYTASGRLHTAYSFDLLDHRFSASHIRRVGESVDSATGAGWVNWALANHDVPRVQTRWGLAEHQAHDQTAPLMVAVASCLRGAACLWQGEELALEEVDVPFEAIQDPYGIRFWPKFKGRDGCRTPMPWDASEKLGFTSGQPWLPSDDKQRARSVAEQEHLESSALNRVRRFLGWRKQQQTLRLGELRFVDTSNPNVLSFVREYQGEQLLCVFNLDSQANPVAFSAAPSDKLEWLNTPGFEQDLSQSNDNPRLCAWGFAVARLG